MTRRTRRPVPRALLLRDARGRFLTLRPRTTAKSSRARPRRKRRPRPLFPPVQLALF